MNQHLEIKFNIHDKVWIKAINRQGIVISRTVEHNKHRSVWDISYDVRFDSDYHQTFDGFALSEYLGKKPSFVRVLQSDLEFYKKPTAIHAVDEVSNKIKEMMDKVLCIDTANGSATITLPDALDLDFYSYKVTSMNPTEEVGVFKQVMLSFCSHKWETYDSGWSKYEFCSKCDEKR